VGNDKANKSIMFGAGTCKGVEIKKLYRTSLVDAWYRWSWIWANWKKL